MTDAPSLAVYGHVGFDVSIWGSEQTVDIGGAAYYAALSASLVTPSVGIAAVIGQDFPASRLQSLQIDLSGLSCRPERSAVFSQRYSATHDVVEFSVQLNACEELSPRLVPERYAQARTFFVTTAPPKQQREILTWLATKQFEGAVAIDTTLAYVYDFRAMLREFSDLVQVVFVNAAEYASLDWTPPENLSCVVKRGSAGVSVWREGVWTDFATPRVERVVATTGAGDVLAGAYLAGISIGDPFDEALQRALALATKSVMAFGVEHLRRSPHDV